MEKDLVSYFFEESSKRFAFLSTEHSFAPPQMKIDAKIHFAFVIFMGRNLAIEFNFDEREGDITCIIARVKNGKRATIYDTNDGCDWHGVRVREYLSQHLKQRGVEETLFTQVGSLNPRERIEVTLEDFAQMLRRHGQEILSDSPTALE